MHYIKPNDSGNGHLIYRLSTDQVLVTNEYQLVHVPEDLLETITDSSDNNIRINHSSNVQPLNQNYHYDNNNDNSLTSSNNMEISGDRICGELDSLQQLSGLKSKKIVDH